MSTLELNCPLCERTVRIGARAAVLDEEAGEYTFVCPSCGMNITKPADERIIRVLKGAGVPLKSGEVPVIPPKEHPEAWNHALPPMTLDDLIDLHEALEIM